MATVRQRQLKPADHALAQEAARLIRARWPAARVIAFGSRARGDARPDSDLDLLVLTGHQVGWQERSPLLDELMSLSIRTGVFVEVLLQPAAIWEDDPLVSNVLRQAVQRDGVEL